MRRGRAGDGLREDIGRRARGEFGTVDRRADPAVLSGWPLRAARAGGVGAPHLGAG